MGTDIAGDLTREQLVAANNKIGYIFNGQIPGYFNNKRAKYDLEYGVSSEGSFIYLNAECRGNLKDFFEPEKLKYWERYYRGAEPGHLLLDNVGRAFPYHGIVIMNHPLYSSYWNKKRRILRAFQKIGYEIGERKSSAYARNWGHETKRELLKSLRQKGIVDPRIRQILGILRENIGADAYTFAQYKPRAKRNLTHNEYRHFEEPEHKTVDFTFQLTDGILEKFELDYTFAFGINRAAGIASTVRIGEEKRHIPMIDFQDRSSLADVEFDLDKLGIPGIVVESGNSFHFYGFETLPDGTWKDFVEETRGLHAIDKNWPDLQMAQGYSMLRITPAYHRLFQPCLIKTRPKAVGDSLRNAQLKMAA